MEIKALMNTVGKAGTVLHISIRAKSREPVTKLQKVMAVAGKGLDGDHYAKQNGNRQVTLIQQEHLDAVASFQGQAAIDPALCRRNIVISGINLLSLKGKQFRIGEALLEYTGECHPCSRMEENLGKGGYNAMRGHGGITARVLESGAISIGDSVTPRTELSSDDGGV